MKTNAPVARLFTDTVDERTAALVYRIVGRHDRFATDFIGVGLDDAAAVAVRLEARQDPRDGLWAIDRFICAPGLGRVQQTTEASHGLCFFDALERCARFQATELAAHDGRRIVDIPGERWTSWPSYRDAAAAVFQVIDENGFVLPCAEGRILTGGSFSIEAMDIAFQTRNEKLAPPAPANALAPLSLVSDLLSVNTPALVTATDRIRRYSDKMARNDAIQAERTNFDMLVDAGVAMTDGLANLVRRAFKTDIPLVRSGLTLGLAPAVGYLRGDERYAPARHFFMLKKRFERCAAMQPAEEKPLVLKFAAAAESAYWLERAARMLKDDSEPGRHSVQAVEKVLACIDRAGAAGGMTLLDVERLKNRSLDHGLAVTAFAQKLAQAWGDYSTGRQLKYIGLESATAIGALLPDGTVFGGISPTTRRFLYIAPKDHPEHMTWEQAASSIRALRNFHGHDGNKQVSEQDLKTAMKAGRYDHGWRLPSAKELQVLYANKHAGALCGTFNEGWYLSSTLEKCGFIVSAEVKHFDTGVKNALMIDHLPQPFRYVRS